MKIDDYDVEVAGVYVNSSGEIKDIPNKKNPKKMQITVPLGYGLIAPAFGTVKGNTAYGATEGDIAVRFSFLEKQLRTGDTIPKEEWDAIENGERDTVQLIMTKNYARKLIEDLQMALEGDGK